MATQLKNQPLCLHSTLGGQRRDAREFGQSPSTRAAQGQTSSSGPSCRKLPCISCVQPPRFSKPCRKLFTISLFSSLGTFINKRTRKYVVGGEQGAPTALPAPRRAPGHRRWWRRSCEGCEHPEHPAAGCLQEPKPTVVLSPWATPRTSALAPGQSTALQERNGSIGLPPSSSVSRRISKAL